MWFSFWRSRDRYSLSELRYLIDQLQKVQIVNEVNKDFVIEALRSVAELITYGDQHDSSFFEVFMEKQVMGEFVRLLNINKAVSVSLQLLQSMGIIIQNLKSEHAIYYIFSNEHINYLITYSFDFSNEELLSYYISFLRAISGKLNKNTISLLVKTHDDEVIYFPLYVEAIRFAFHEENMIRTAVRALTLNVYHVGDNCVNKYITSPPHADYFSNLVTFFCEQCIALNGLVSDTSKNLCSESYSHIFPAVDEIEDNLYYFSDIISAGIPDVGRLITDCMLQLLIFPLLLPPLSMETMEGTQISIVTSLYLLCSILRIVKIKDMANAVAASFFCRPAAFVSNSEAKLNGLGHGSRGWSIDTSHMVMRSCNLSVTIPNSYSSTEIRPKYISKALRDALLSYIATGDDAQVFASLSMLATLLQTKELDESMLDALGILPERKQHKKLLLQALVGELSGEEQLFSSENSSLRDGTNSELDAYLLQLKNRYGISCSLAEVGGSPQMHRFEVVDVLVGLLCRSSVSADPLWDGGWLLRQLLPYSQAEFKSDHLQMLKGAYKKCIVGLLQEVKGVWPDFLLTVLCDEWKKCKRAVEASSLQREPKCVFFPLQRPCFEEVATAESSTAAAERMWELVKVFVLLHQLQIFILGRSLSELPPINPPISVPENFRAKTAGLDPLGPKSGAELSLVDALPCRIAFERGKERHFCFLAVALGTSGWLVLADELPLKQHYGVVRVAAPLAGSDPKIDEHHSKWLHLRIRPSTSPFLETIKFEAKGRAKTRTLVDGRWTLAFRNEESCKSAMSMILEEIKVQSSVVERSLRPLFDLEYDMNLSDFSSSSSSLPFKTIS